MKNMAAAKAKREMIMDAEQARKKRNKLNGQGNGRAEQEAISSLNMDERQEERKAEREDTVMETA